MKEKRNDKIKDYILHNEQVSLKELQTTFNVSMNTIRRDISLILDDPRFEKVYGGIQVKENPIVSYENRSVKNRDIKMSIAKEAAAQINNSDLIYIDSGTTTKYILDFLDKDINITVITNSLDVIVKAEHFPNMSLFAFGNIFRKKTRSFVGISPNQIIDKYNVSKAFISAAAVSIDNGLMNADILEYEMKKQIVGKASKVYLLADQSKFNKSNLFTFASLHQVSDVFTDFQVTQDYLDYFNEHDIIVHHL